MTAQSMVTIVAPIARPNVAQARALIGTLGNPATPAVLAAIAPEGQPAFLHFASFHAIEGSDGKSAFFVLEFSADGSSAEATRLLAARLGPQLSPIFALSQAWEGGDLGEFLLRQRIEIGYRFTDTPGLAFCGTPGQSVGEIEQQARLAARIAELLADQQAGLYPLGRLSQVRRLLGADPQWAWALGVPPPAPHVPASEPTTFTRVRALALPFLTTYAWPLLILLLVLAVLMLWPEHRLAQPPACRGLVGCADLVASWLLFAGKAALLALAGLVAVLGLAYLRFRRAEDSDWISERAPDAAEIAEIYARENPEGHVQNHMVSHTVLKPGLLRKFTVRLVFWGIARLAPLNPRPGHLGDIGTIHYARWITIPGTRDFLFFSNYGGSWESYLEDFITRANQGLTAVWSNAVGFPRTRNLFLGGASDAERFKRYARQSMLHTPFWYSAYPGLTTANIRTNALIRRGLAGAVSEEEAVRWLALFGSAPRPIEKLETTQIQSIVFGGLGFKPHGRLLVIELPDGPGSARWLAEVRPYIAFNDGRYAWQRAVLTLAATASGLAKLGLPAAGLETFPAAFLSGMCGPGRDRILGDIRHNAPENWWWGRSANDLVLLVYGDDQAAVEHLRQTIDSVCRPHGARIAHEVPLTPTRQGGREREPFGFVDGVSQPAIRGTYRGLRNDDPIHLVEPGEFVIGYPDNRGNVPPGPLLDASYDPDLELPIAGHDQGFSQCIAENPRTVGHNGSFLVIRQLEQHVERFNAYCAEQAEHIAPHVAHLPVEPDPASLTEYVGAKMIGRWKDGSSLARYPYVSASRLKELLGKDRSAAIARPEARPANPDARPIKAAEAQGPVASRGAGAEASIKPDNDFLFGTEDPQGLRCPYGAHIRRANPRDSLDPGSEEQIQISNRHRILRVGRGYQDPGNPCAGLMFMCLAGDIERQFEFIQQTWMGSTTFHGLTAETDPIVSDGQPSRCSFTVPTRAGPIALQPMPQFVTMRGGGYYFLPGKQLIDWLASR